MEWNGFHAARWMALFVACALYGCSKQDSTPSDPRGSQDTESSVDVTGAPSSKTPNGYDARADVGETAAPVTGGHAEAASSEVIVAHDGNEPGRATSDSPAESAALNSVSAMSSDEDVPADSSASGASVASGQGDAAVGTAKAADRHVQAEPGDELFQGWPEPRAVLVFTGRQHGYVEPCGCSGLEHQKGGLVRRYALIQQLKEKGWTTVPIDAGNQVRRFGRQPEIKFQITIEGLRTMGYRAVAFGPDDLRLPAAELVAVVAGDEQHPSRFVSANAVIFDSSFTPTFQVVEANGIKIGITAVLGERNQKKVNDDDIQLRDAAEALTEVWPELSEKGCDFYVLIAHASIKESIALAKKFPQFPIVLTTGGAGEPTRQPQPIAGTDSQLIQVGTQGMFAGVVGLFDDPTTPTRYQRVTLDGRFKDTPVMLQLLAAYQDQLKEVGFEELGIRVQRHPTGRLFVGAETCAECHEKIYDVWKDGLDGKGGPHAKAYHSLLHPPERTQIARNFDPECVSCHVVGWNSQQYYPYESGYLSQETTPDKLNVGCENCHGPGSAHVEAENGDVDLDDAAIERLQEQMVLPLDKAEQKCLECHDLDNSPNFHEKGAFAKYWAKIRH